MANRVKIRQKYSPPRATQTRTVNTQRGGQRMFLAVVQTTLTAGSWDATNSEFTLGKGTAAIMGADKIGDVANVQRTLSYAYPNLGPGDGSDPPVKVVNNPTESAVLDPASGGNPVIVVMQSDVDGQLYYVPTAAPASSGSKYVFNGWSADYITSVAANVETALTWTTSYTNLASDAPSPSPTSGEWTFDTSTYEDVYAQGTFHITFSASSNIASKYMEIYPQFHDGAGWSTYTVNFSKVKFRADFEYDTSTMTYSPVVFSGGWSVPVTRGTEYSAGQHKFRVVYYGTSTSISEIRAEMQFTLHKDSNDA